MLMIMGCTEPSESPNITEHTAIANAVAMNGYKPKTSAVITMATVITTRS